MIKGQRCDVKTENKVSFFFNFFNLKIEKKMRSKTSINFQKTYKHEDGSNRGVHRNL